jgi:hypothetical protein
MGRPKREVREPFGTFNDWFGVGTLGSSPMPTTGWSPLAQTEMGPRPG